MDNMLPMPDIAIDILNSLYLADDPSSAAKRKGKRLVAMCRVEKLGVDAVKRMFTSTVVTWKKKCTVKRAISDSESRAREAHQPVTTNADIDRSSTTTESGVPQDKCEMNKYGVEVKSEEDAAVTTIRARCWRTRGALYCRIQVKR
jgi:hypothetical protein